MIGLMILTLTIDLSIWVTLHPCHAIMVGLLGYHSLSMACTVHIGRLWMWCCGHGQSSTFRSLRWLVLPDVYASKNDRRLASEQPTVPKAPTMRLPIPNQNPNLNSKTHPNPNPIFNPNTNLFFERKQKRHWNIGQHRVIFTGYLLKDGDGFIRGP